jgi:c-di-GMP-binding flagellar brake protein YcgR
MDDNYPDVERRQHKRIKVNFTVVYRVDKPLQFRMMIGNRQVDALMLDLSEGGMSILTDCNLPIGAELSIKFTLIGAHPYDANRSITMEVTGEVRYNIIVRKNERRVGILFTKIGEKDKVTISNFVEKLFLNKS